MMLKSFKFTVKIHFEIIHIIDVSSELYYFYYWVTFIHATSEEYTIYSDSSSLFSSDIVQYCCLNNDCICQNRDRLHLNHVTAVEKNY